MNLWILCAGACHLAIISAFIIGIICRMLCLLFKLWDLCFIIWMLLYFVHLVKVLKLINLYAITQFFGFGWNSGMNILCLLNCVVIFLWSIAVFDIALMIQLALQNIELIYKKKSFYLWIVVNLCKLEWSCMLHVYSIDRSKCRKLKIARKPKPFLLNVLLPVSSTMLNRSSLASLTFFLLCLAAETCGMCVVGLRESLMDGLQYCNNLILICPL